MPVQHPVHPWPCLLPLPLPGNGLIVMSIATAGAIKRDFPRQQIRLALRQVLAEWLGLAPDDIGLTSEAGQAPRLALAGNGAAPTVGLSISHETGLSLAAINLHGAVGVDLMRVQEVPDWESVARDYLGGASADALAGASPERRSQAFSRAWTAHEASLKCQGLPLAEWMPSLPFRALPCRCFDLALPDGLIGTLAVPAVRPA